ncbi:MAG: hypothetical protein R6U98_15315 [Pirellulaceae bacterium]
MKRLHHRPLLPVADDFLRHESDQREDGLRRAAFHSEKSNRLKYKPRDEPAGFGLVDEVMPPPGKA